MIDIAGKELITSLIKSVGDGGHNIVAITDLLGELLSRLRMEMNEEAGLVPTNVTLNKKERRKLEKRIAQSEIGMCVLFKSVAANLWLEDNGI